MNADAEPAKPALYAVCDRRQGTDARRIVFEGREPTEVQRAADALRAAGAEVEIALISTIRDETIPRAMAR